jgi:GNAT superfamily N-acetyltransferase
MKITELELHEIERLSKSGFEGGKDYLKTDYSAGKTIGKLPGGSGLLYSVAPDSGDMIVRLWDNVNKGEYEPTPKPVPSSFYSRRENQSRVEYWERRNAEKKREFDRAPGKLVGQLTLHPVSGFPLKGALQVGTITVDEDYRGIGLAKALYGIVLTILKRPLLAGSSQTPGGRMNWVSLSQIPGVEMKGYFSIHDYDLTTHDTKNISRASDRKWVQKRNQYSEQLIDTIMGKLGGQHLGNTAHGHFFAFDVQPNTTKQELKAHVDTQLNKVYGGYNSDTGLYAIWTGQQ